MKHLKKFLVLLLLVPMCVHAEVAVNDKQEEINSSAISSGDEVTSANKVDGINMLFGNNVTLEGSSEYALLAGNVVNISGNVIKDGFVFGNVIKFDENASVNRDLVIFGNEVEINGTLNRDVMIYAYSVKVNGEIKGHLNIKATDITIDESSIEKLSYNKDAAVEKSDKAVINEILVTDKLIKDFSFGEKVTSFIINIGSVLVVFLALYFIVPKLFKKLEKKNKDLNSLSFFSLFGFGALSIILIPVVFLLLLNLVLGLPLALLLLVCYIIAICLSSIFTGYLIGYLIWKYFVKKESNSLLIGLMGILILQILSIIPICADLAGTKLPICAISTISATCLMYVDLPAILGPVMIANLFSFESKYASFCTKDPAESIFSITGCLPSFISIISDLSISGMQ